MSAVNVDVRLMYRVGSLVLDLGPLAKIVSLTVSVYHYKIALTVTITRHTQIKNKILVRGLAYCCY